MIRFLLSMFHKSKTEKHFSVLGFQQLFRCALILLMILFVQQASAQQLDTWLTADRAINVNPIPVGSVHLFTPYAPADGTPVNIWYDFIDFTPQDGVPHPNPVDYPLASPAGFDYPFGTNGIDFLSPTGSQAGIPTLRRDIFNFNPAVEFDGSGNGEALHFRSNSRNEVAVFIVFQGAGAGNNAEEQRLLFGGDIDVHPNSLSNLSLGVSAGNRFSVGRTWDSDGGGYFQSGSIDLQQRPTIATFVRDIVEPLGSEQEQLETWVNGLPDINITRNHATSESELFIYNRLGKHFNSNDSNRNFTGYIAEVLLLDTPAEINMANAIERTQSYLAIKYGITLNEIGGLGSINGNNSFYYLAADGSVIWDWDINSPYNYDIAGIGKDRFDDIDNTPGPYDPTDSYLDIKYRYNLYQRISKSINPEAIVTVSTNSNFTSDNLDDTRTAIDTGPSSFSTRHNYLIWGNDRASILSTNAELPDGGTTVTERISREWKVQMSRSSLADDPIQGVSVRVELSGSDIPLTDPCALHLMIDTDGDGDFTTGLITYIPATSIIGTDAFFDNVDFEDRDVFTIGFGDFTDPTATNPDPITVCDSAPAPNPNDVDDEDDNCAVDMVVHIDDVSDGNTNPETITRTYRITDTSGNFIDVEQIILVYTTPDVDDIANVISCGSYQLPEITGSNLTGNESYYDTPGGPSGGGTSYAENDVINSDITLYIYDETGSTPNCYDEESFTITINPTPAAPAAIDQSFCDTPTPTGDDLVPDINLAAITWYSDPALTTKVLATDALSAQTYYVTQTQGGCESVPTAIIVTIDAAVVADDPADVANCGPYELPPLTNGNYFDAPNGGGNALSAGDFVNASTTLYVFSPANGSCPAVDNSFDITIDAAVVADDPADVANCGPYELPPLTNGNYFDAPNGGGNALS
ncbi:hypothetical protein J4E06_13350, partial [Muricauda sp. NFXS6]